MELLDFKFRKLEADTNLSAFSFCCGDNDLNEFLFDDSKLYLNTQLSLTYFFYTGNDIVAYFSLSHDVLKHHKSLFGGRSRHKDFKKNQMGLSHNLYGYELPGIKIGRLAVNTKYMGNKYGTQLLDVIKSVIYNQRFAGCRLITVDAYNDAISFYEKNNFHKLLSEKVTDHTTQMYFDLNTLE